MSFRSVGYYYAPSSDQAKFSISSIPADLLTHINYAFAGINDDGTVTVSDDDVSRLGQLVALKQQNPNLKIMLSIGGAGQKTQNRFSSIASDSGRLGTFVSTAVNLVNDHGLDGLDVDWEFPAADDASHFVEMLKELRTGLGTAHELSIAVSAGSDNYNNLVLQIANMDQYLSFWNLMAYDYVGSGWMKATTDVSGNQANLYPRGTLSTDSAVDWYVNQQKIPANKFVIGIPLYGRTFEKCGGLNKPFDWADQGGNPFGSGIYPYNQLPYGSDADGVTYDSTAVATYYVNPDGPRFVTFDDKRSVTVKANYVKNGGLGGVMFWELSGDCPRESGYSLVATAHDVLFQP